MSTCCFQPPQRICIAGCWQEGWKSGGAGSAGGRVQGRSRFLRWPKGSQPVARGERPEYVRQVRLAFSNMCAVEWVSNVMERRDGTSCDILNHFSENLKTDGFHLVTHLHVDIVGKYEGRRPIGKYLDWIHVHQDQSSGGFMWKRQWTLGLHKWTSSSNPTRLIACDKIIICVLSRNRVICFKIQTFTWTVSWTRRRKINH